MEVLALVFVTCVHVVMAGPRASGPGAVDPIGGGPGGGGPGGGGPGSGVFGGGGLGGGGDLNTKADCLWDWSAWSAPFGFGNTERTVDIYRHPRNGGKPCPTTLTQVKKLPIPKLPPVEYVAKQVVDNFLSTRLSTEKNTYKRDLLIILDSSSSINKNQFNKAKKNLAKLIGLICPRGNPFRSDRHRAALIKFSTNVHDAFYFNTHKNTPQIKKAIRSETYLGGTTRTFKAFERALTHFTPQRGMRSNTHHDVLILTDGQSNGGDYRPPLNKLKAAGVKVFALAIKIVTNSGRAEIEDYVSEPRSQHLFALENFTALDKLLAEIQRLLPQIICAPFDVRK